MNTFDNIQRREVIDEDKKIHKRALDAEFAFIKRLGEETLPATELDKRAEFNLIRAIEDVALQIANVQEDLSPYADRAERGEDVGTVNIILYGTVKYWNILVGYIKSFINLNRLSQAQYEEIWQKIDSRITSGVNYISDIILYFDSKNIEYKFPENAEFELLYDYLQDRNLSPIVVQKREPSRRKIEKSFETIAQKNARLRQEGEELQQALAQQQAELEQQQAEADAIQQDVDENENVVEEPPAAPAPPPPPPKPKRGRPPKKKAGEGKPRQMKKRMGDDDNELNIISFDSHKTKDHLNHMKKAEKKAPLTFNDSNDSNYL